MVINGVVAIPTGDGVSGDLPGSREVKGAAARKGAMGKQPTTAS